MRTLPHIHVPAALHLQNSTKLSNWPKSHDMGQFRTGWLLLEYPDDKANSFLRHGSTWFGSKLSLAKHLELPFCWAHIVPIHTVVKLTHISEKSFIQEYSVNHDVCLKWLVNTRDRWPSEVQCLSCFLEQEIRIIH